MTTDAPTPRTRVRRLPELGVYERARVYAIIDEALYCHLSWVGEDGDPRVIPTIHARIDDTLYVHGSNASTTLRGIKGGVPVAIAITIVDGIRFARSMFEHSMNYRTVVVYGRTEEVTDPNELATVFDAITDQVAPGTALEINAYPDRLDLRDEHVLWAKRHGVKFAIDTDSHSTVHLAHMRYGIGTAQRGWVTKDDVINAWPLSKLKAFLKKKGR